MVADEVKKKGGRPSLPPEEKERRRKAKIMRDNDRQKECGYPAHKNYMERHRGEIYEAMVRIPSSNKPILEQLLSKTGLTVTQLFVDAIKEKYGVDLSKLK